jgi:hypothetical protein
VKAAHGLIDEGERGTVGPEEESVIVAADFPIEGSEFLGGQIIIRPG